MKPDALTTSRIRVEFRGLDGDVAMEATEADLEDRRRRLRRMGVS